MIPAATCEPAAGVPVHPARDTAAVEAFAYELLCDAAAPTPAPLTTGPGRTARLRASALNPARLERPEAPPGRRPLPLAYEFWLDYLFELDALVHRVQFGPASLTAYEWQGLQALARARARFLRRYLFCPHCEGANPRGVRRCAHCQKEL